MNMFTDEGASSRREFLKMLGKSLAGVSIVGFVAPLVNSCSMAAGPGAQVASFTITVDVSSLTQNNTAVRTTTPDGNSLLVVRQSATSYITLLLICTHELCGGSSMVLSGSSIICTCHDSRFDLAGHVTRGPAQTDLTTYSTVYDAAKKKVTVHN